MTRTKSFFLASVFAVVLADSAFGQSQDFQAPTTPTGLVATPVGATTINLTWNASTDNVAVTSYVVRRNGVRVGTPSTTSYTDTGLSPATTYSYTVAARDAVRNVSPESASVSAKTGTATDTIAPTAPTGLSATASGSAQINLAWVAATDNVSITGYLVERCLGTSCTGFAQIGSVAGTITTYSDSSGLAAGTTYTYRVRATDAAPNLGPYSIVANTTTLSGTSGLVAAYAFNEGVGTTVADVSGNGNTGTISGASWITTGKFGGALVFNGTSAQVTVPNSASLRLTTGMTLEAWAFPTVTPTGWRALVGKNVDSYYLMASSDQGNRAAVGGTWIAGNQNTYGSSVLAANTWTHVAATFDGARVRLFVNGAQVASQAQTTALAPTNGTLQIGGSSFPYEYFAGRIDEVRVYNRALSAAEIQTDMNTAVGGTPIPDTTAPSVPTGLSAAAAGASQVNLAWSASTDNVGVTGYIVRRNGIQVATPTSTSYIDTGLLSGSTYSYTVAARDAAGNVSAYSAIVNATTGSAVDTTSPSVPGGLVATASGGSVVNLTWSASTDNVGVTGYIVRRNGVQIGTPTTPSYSDTGLTSATAYTYTVAARDAANNVSANSTSASATTADTIAPATPTGLLASAAGATTINLTWNASTDNVGVTAYVVRRNGIQVGTPSTPGYSDTGLSGATMYNYTVAARDAANNVSPESAVVSATTADTIAPSIPAGLVASAAGATTINLTWSASTDNVAVSGYIVKRNGTQVGTSVTPSFADTGLLSGLTYSYTVAARDAANNVSSDSASVSATTADATPPSTPGGLVATAAAGAATINLTWSASTDNVGVTGYIVKRNGTQVGTSVTPGYTDTGLSSLTTYNYTVAARDAAGNLSPESVIASATTADITPPSMPAGLVATAAGSAAINLTWGASSDNVGVTGYIVKRNGVQVGTSASPNYADTGLSAATAYSYTVAARDAANNISPDSASASATTTSAADTTPPSTPTGLVATVAGATSINLTWTASTDNVAVTSYIVKRNGAQVGTTSTPGFTDTGLTAATLYTYTVEARDAAGNVSPDSTSVSATTTSAADATPPSTPTGLVAVAAGATINLTWNASSDNVGVTGYIVRRNGTQVGTPTTTSFADTGLLSGLTYSYTVAARDAAGNVSPNSASVDATTADTTPPSVPTNVAATTGATTVNLTWTASTDNVGVTGYIVKRNGVQVGTSVAPSYADTGLASATTYTYTIAARDAVNNISSDSAIASATTADTTAPTVPTGLVAAAAGATAVNLSWNVSTDNVAVTGYVVRRNGVQVATPSTTSYTDTGLSSATTYAYTVAARDAAGNVSANSSSASATPVDTIAPSTPAGLVATAAVGAASITLTWTASTDNVAVTGYIVKRNGVQVATPGTTSYTDSGLASATSYSYTVAARDAAANISPDSASVSATTVDTTAPSTPAGLVATAAAGAATINLTWTASTDNIAVTGYIVKRNGVQVGTPATTSYADTGLVAATTYNYTVAARDAAGNVSSESAIASATTANTVFPLHTEAGKRYLIDAAGKPFLLHADTAWSLIAELSLADAEVYLEDRRQKGFNAVLVNLLEHKYSTHAPNNIDNVAPFTTPGNYSTPNEAYFAHADAVIQKAAAKGILVLLTPSYLGYGGGAEGWYQEMWANGTTRMRNYGRYLGQRYGSYSNILWVHGGDFNPPSSNKALVSQIALGIKDFDTLSLHTAHCTPETSALEYWSGESWLQVNTIYTYVDVRSKAVTEYQRSPSMPFLLIESRYENENLPEGTEEKVRIEAYQALLSGAMGQTFGNSPIWHFTGPGVFPTGTPATWQGWLGSPGAQSMVNVRSLFASRAWWTLLPDASNTLLTGGFLGSGSTASTSDRAVAAKANDGSFAIVYMPRKRTVTVDLGQLAGPKVTARWYDPSNGVFSSAGAPFTITTHPQPQQFTPLGNNASTSGSYSDWVLVLESVP